MRLEPWHDAVLRLEFEAIPDPLVWGDGAERLALLFDGWSSPPSYDLLDEARRCAIAGLEWKGSAEDLWSVFHRVQRSGRHTGDGPDESSLDGLCRMIRTTLTSLDADGRRRLLPRLANHLEVARIEFDRRIAEEEEEDRRHWADTLSRMGRWERTRHPPVYMTRERLSAWYEVEKSVGLVARIQRRLIRVVKDRKSVDRLARA